MIVRRLLSVSIGCGLFLSAILWLWSLEMMPVALRYTLRMIAALYLFSVALVLYYRFRNPAFTLYMRRMRKLQAELFDVHIDGFVRQWIPYDAMSDEIKLAAIAGEDIYFAFHYGFDWESIRQALHYNKTTTRDALGASTITQQMVKNLFLWPARSVVRKVLEAYLTLLVEGLWTKQRILEVYLNLAQFSDAIFGVEAAAQAAFGQPASQLDRKQAALLITVLPNPILLSIHSPSHAVRMRQVVILESMRRLGMSYLAWI
jgi:monofunctional glycosyltransferase